MPRDIYNDTIISADPNGVPTVLMAGVLVTVYKAGTQTTATIYQDRAQPTQQANPFEAVKGIVRFWADQGEYDVNYHDPQLRIADQTIGWNSIPGGAAGINQGMMVPGVTPPPGSLFPYAGTAEPTGYKFANGQALLKTTYATLFTALGGQNSPFGQDATTFNLPDLRSRLPIGAGTGAGLTARTLGSYGGGTLDTANPKRAEEMHTLSNAEMPSHSHGGATSSSAPTTGWMDRNNPHNHGGLTAAMDRPSAHAHGDSGHAHGIDNLATGNASVILYGSGLSGHGSWTAPGVGHTGTDARNVGVTATDINHLHGINGQDINHLHSVPNLAISADGGSQPHNIMSPYLALNYIIRDGT